MCRDYNSRNPRLMYPSIVRILGIDYGRRRIGLAISDPSGTIARPLKAMTGHGDAARAAETIAIEIARLASEDDGLGGVVLGLPTKLGGGPTDQTREVEAFAARLRARIAVPIVLQDERLSSREAESRLATRIKDWRERKQLLDAAAAAVILQDYLDRSSAASLISTDDRSHTEDDQT
jgi:putative Holliday junction resolvase